LNTVFQIGNLSGEEAVDTVFVELNQTFCSLAFVNSVAKSVLFIGMYTFDTFSLDKGIDDILKIISERKYRFQNTIISPGFPEALLIPNKFYHYKSSLVNSIYNQNHFYYLTDPIAEWQLMNVYAIPVAVHKKLSEKLPLATYIHAYTPLLKIYNGFTSDNQLSAHFIGKQFRVLVKKQHQVQLIQTYSYSSPMDVVYFLLKICTEFQLSQEDTQIIISGLIDEDSALYKELHNYFLQLHFAISTTVLMPEHEHPNHFFTSIHNLAACVL
jgi:hypothetical protein